MEQTRHYFCDGTKLDVLLPEREEGLVLSTTLTAKKINWKVLSHYQI